MENRVVDSGQGNLDNVVKKKRVVSDMFDIETLMKLREIFSEDGEGEDSLSEDKFRQVMSEYLSQAEIDDIYPKIDINDDGNVEWHEFTNFLIAAEGNSKIASYAQSYRLVQLPYEQPQGGKIAHHDLIDHICFSARPTPVIITGGRDGQLFVWKATDLKVLKKIKHESKNIMQAREMLETLPVAQKAMVTMLSMRTNSAIVNVNDKNNDSSSLTITSLCCMPVAGHICVGSNDNSICVYELLSYECIGRLSLANMPTALSAFAVMERTGDTEFEQFNVQPACTILIGDSAGALSAIRVSSDFGPTIDSGTKKRNQALITKAFEKPYCMNIPVHEGCWITNVMYVEDCELALTAGVDGLIYFVDYHKRQILKVFDKHVRIATGFSSTRGEKAKAESESPRRDAEQAEKSPKRERRCKTNTGIVSFDYSKVGKYMVSASDRKLLWWDLFTLETVFTITDRFTAPIIKVCVHDEVELLFVATSDKVMYLFHNITYELLQCVTDETWYRPLNQLSSVMFAPALKRFYSAGNRVTTWALERGTESTAVSDEDDICCVLHNSLFQQIVTVYRSGVVEVHSVEDNSIVTKFDISTYEDNRKADLKFSAQMHDRLFRREEESNPGPLSPEGGKSSQKKAPNKGNKEGKLNPDEVVNEPPAVIDEVIPFIQLASFDKLQRRLIIVTRFQNIQLWNFNNCECLQILTPILPRAKNGIPVGSLAISNILCEDAFLGARKALRKLLFFGTDNGFMFAVQDPGDGAFADEAAFVLVRKRHHLLGDIESQSQDKPPSVAVGFSSVNDSLGSDSVDGSMSNSMSMTRSTVIDDDHVSSTVDDHHVLLNAFLKTKKYQVLWSTVSMDDKLIVSYNDGTLAAWDLNFRMGYICNTYDLKASAIILSCTNKPKANSLNAKMRGRIERNGSMVAGRASVIKQAMSVAPENSSTSASKSVNSRQSHIISEGSHISGRSESVLDRNNEVLKAIEAANASYEANMLGGKAVVSLPKHYANGVLRTIKPGFYDDDDAIPEHGSESGESEGEIETQNMVRVPHSSVPVSVTLKSITDGATGRDSFQNSSRPLTSGSDTFNIDAALPVVTKAPMLPGMKARNTTISNVGVVVPSAAIDQLILSPFANRQYQEPLPNSAHGNWEAFFEPEISSQDSPRPVLVPSRPFMPKPSSTITFANEPSVSSESSLFGKTVGSTTASDSQKLTMMHGTNRKTILRPRIGISLAHLPIKPSVISATMDSDEESDGSGSRVLGEEKSIEEHEKPRVHCAVILKSKIPVIVGACSDKMIRFWHLSTSTLLCMCKYLDAPPEESVNKDDGEVISSMMCDEGENLLIAGFENGKITVWKIALLSLISLNEEATLNKTSNFNSTPLPGATFNTRASAYINLKIKQNSGAPVIMPPLAFIAQWRAHESAIVSAQYFSFNYEANQAFVPAVPPAEVVGKPFVDEKKSVSSSSHVKSQVERSMSIEDSAGSSIIEVEGSKSTVIDEKVTAETQSYVPKKEIKYSTAAQRSATAAFRNKIVHSGHLHSLVLAEDVHTLLMTTNNSAHHPSAPNGHGQRNVSNGPALDSQIDGFIVTAGKDQVVYLWSIIGEFVGRVGSSMWDIYDSTSWGGGRYESLEKQLMEISLGKVSRHDLENQKISWLRGGYYDDKGTFHAQYISRYDKYGNCNEKYVKGLSDYLNTLTSNMIRGNAARHREPGMGVHSQNFMRLLQQYPVNKAAPPVCHRSAHYIRELQDYNKVQKIANAKTVRLNENVAVDNTDLPDTTQVHARTSIMKKYENTLEQSKCIVRRKSPKRRAHSPPRESTPQSRPTSATFAFMETLNLHTSHVNKNVAETLSAALNEYQTTTTSALTYTAEEAVSPASRAVSRLGSTPRVKKLISRK